MFKLVLLWKSLPESSESPHPDAFWILSEKLSLGKLAGHSSEFKHFNFTYCMSRLICSFLDEFSSFILPRQQYNWKFISIYSEYHFLTMYDFPFLKDHELKIFFRV